MLVFGYLGTQFMKYKISVNRYRYRLRDYVKLKADFNEMLDNNNFDKLEELEIRLSKIVSIYNNYSFELKVEYLFDKIHEQSDKEYITFYSERIFDLVYSLESGYFIALRENYNLNIKYLIIYSTFFTFCIFFLIYRAINHQSSNKSNRTKPGKL